eukprot:SAG31_NODE_179_length_21090_cov_11.862871_22_plen_81_part_00
MVSNFLHIPCGFLAILDVMAVKDSAKLRQETFSVANLLIGYAVYTIAYLSLVHVNHLATGHWPYGILYKLGDSPTKWCAP